MREQLVSLGAGWVRFPFHLLNAPRVAAAVDEWAASGVPVVADDPFAGGLLDGQWLSGSPLESPAVPRGLEWETTRRRLAPVAGLGYLTVGAGRTLPQAALSYLREREGVSGVLVRVASAQDFAKLAPGGRPLGATDRQRIEGRSLPEPTAAPGVPSNTSPRSRS